MFRPLDRAECRAEFSGAIPDVVGEGGWIVPDRAERLLPGCWMLSLLTRKRLRRPALPESSRRYVDFPSREAETLACAWHSAYELRRSNTTFPNPTDC
jgi:hypothetical protein